MKCIDILLGRPVAVVAVMAITVLGVMDELTWRVNAIIVLGIVMVTHSIAGYLREQRIGHKLERNYRRVSRRTLDLLVELSDLTAEKVRPWIIELYLPRYRRTLRRRWPFVVKRDLFRELSITLGAPPMSPAMIDGGHELFGECLEHGSRALWWDRGVANLDLGHDNDADRLSEETNDELRSAFGMVAVWPLVGRLGRNCMGLMIIHTNRDVEMTTMVLGAFRQQRAGLKLRNAVSDMHNWMQADGQ